jgi:hypothetical protein
MHIDVTPVGNDPAAPNIERSDETEADETGSIRRKLLERTHEED